MARRERSNPGGREGPDTFRTRWRHKIRRMESPTLARQSVSADVSEFARAELEAFVAYCKRHRPAAWARVEQLQRICRQESPTEGVEPTIQAVPESVNA